jgi:hypothetical protein
VEDVDPILPDLAGAGRGWLLLQGTAAAARAASGCGWLCKSLTQMYIYILYTVHFHDASSSSLSLLEIFFGVELRLLGCAGLRTGVGGVDVCSAILYPLR